MRYQLMRGERVARSAANMTCADAFDFMSVVSRTPLLTPITTLAIEDANTVLLLMWSGGLTGAAVLAP